MDPVHPILVTTVRRLKVHLILPICGHQILCVVTQQATRLLSVANLNGAATAQLQESQPGVNGSSASLEVTVSHLYDIEGALSLRVDGAATGKHS